MSEIINLRRYRKKQARETAEQTAEARRLQFGRTKAQREADAAAEQKKQASLDGHRRVREDEI
jgi:membrane protein involved in colicin uptake